MSHRSFKLAALAALSVGLAGCADFSGIAPTAKLRDGAALGWHATAAPQAAVDAQWWRVLGDEQLNSLIAQAIEGNPSLRLAQTRLARASAVVDATGASSAPQLNASVDLTHQRYTSNGAVPPPLAGSVRDSGSLQLSASWELDFFNKNRSALDAALGQVRAVQADADAARVLLASQVARSYIQLARLNAQLAVAQRVLAQREHQLRLVRERVSAGLDTQLELRQSEGGLPEARLQIEQLQEQSALGRNALAALVGLAVLPAEFRTPVLDRLGHAAAATSIPADLLGQRADVAAARWRVEAATQDAAAARAQFYPNINLVGFAGLSSIGLDRLIDGGSLQWGVGPALRLPLFDGGRLRANLRGKTADLDAAIESYNAAVLGALREVADQLASARAIERQQTEQRAAQAAAQGAYELAGQRYRSGLGHLLAVLNAETAVLAQQRAAADLAARRLDTEVALLHALGGGYTPAAAADTADTTKKIAINDQMTGAAGPSSH